MKGVFKEVAQVRVSGVAWGAGDPGLTKTPGWPEAPGTADWWGCQVSGNGGVGWGAPGLQ